MTPMGGTAFSSRGRKRPDGLLQTSCSHDSDCCPPPAQMGHAVLEWVPLDSPFQSPPQGRVDWVPHTAEAAPFGRRGGSHFKPKHQHLAARKTPSSKGFGSADSVGSGKGRLGTHLCLWGLACLGGGTWTKPRSAGARP